MELADLPTPCLILDLHKMRRNLARMADHIHGLGCTLRPHVKTHKSRDVLEEVLATIGGPRITVSTLAEAEYFLDAGITDIMYAVGITPRKLEAVQALSARGADIKIILDSLAMAEMVIARAGALGGRFRVLVELDVDGHRSGVNPDSDELIAIGRRLDESVGTELVGVMTHAGGSYELRSAGALRAAAANERERAVHAAERLRAAGLPAPIVSIGSTPTALSAESLSGVTEVRAGVYTFFDLVQAGIGVCEVDDIALSVLATVIGHQEEKGWTIVDAGWMALSRDRGTASQTVDRGYGLVTDMEGNVLDAIVGAANQEHGIIFSCDGQEAGSGPFELGAMLRILPNHACATAAQHEAYHVLEDGRITAKWPRLHGW